MRESQAFYRHRARVPAFSAAGLSLVLSITSCVGAGDQAGGAEDAAGVAVTVQLESGATVPGIFRGSRGQASEHSGGSFHFEEGAERVAVLRPGALWFVDDGSAEPARPGFLAIIVHREDGSIVPGEFRGPPRLAEAVSEAWATERGVTDPPPSIVLVLPERRSRVRVIPPGTAVRTIPSS
jgi:hypothetical protein